MQLRSDTASARGRPANTSFLAPCPGNASIVDGSCGLEREVRTVHADSDRKCVKIGDEESRIMRRLSWVVQGRRRRFSS